jgi:hypothetical protein
MFVWEEPTPKPAFSQSLRNRNHRLKELSIHPACLADPSARKRPLCTKYILVEYITTNNSSLIGCRPIELVAKHYLPQLAFVIHSRGFLVRLPGSFMASSF